MDRSLLLRATNSGLIASMRSLDHPGDSEVDRGAQPDRVATGCVISTRPWSPTRFDGPAAAERSPKGGAKRLPGVASETPWRVWAAAG